MQVGQARRKQWRDAQAALRRWPRPAIPMLASGALPQAPRIGFATSLTTRLAPPQPRSHRLQVSHGDFVTAWAALPRLSGNPTADTSDLQPQCADLVKVVSGSTQVRYS